MVGRVEKRKEKKKEKGVDKRSVNGLIPVQSLD